MKLQDLQEINLANIAKHLTAKQKLELVVKIFYQILDDEPWTDMYRNEIMQAGALAAKLAKKAK